MNLFQLNICIYRREIADGNNDDDDDDKLYRILQKSVHKDKSTLLAGLTLLFGLIVIIAILLFQKNKAPETNYHPFKLIGLMFVGTISVFLIPSGFSNQQITPIIGLLGTLAGYLVGSSNNNQQINSNSTSAITTQPKKNESNE